MTIASEIQRIKTNIENAYTALELKGATMPATEDSANLALTIAGVPSGGETIQATNQTGGNISEGDKVWINKSGNDYNLKNLYTPCNHYTDFSLLGNIVLDTNTGILSNFSTSNYLVLPKSLTSYNTFEIRLKFKNTSLNNGCNVILADPNVDGDGIVIGVSNNSGLWLGISGSSNWSIYDSNQSTSTFALDTWYYVKLVFDGSSYVLSSSTDKINWTIEHSVSTSSKVSMNKLGLGLLNNDNNYYQKGYIDLSECYIKIDDEFWWNPVQEGIKKDLLTPYVFDFANNNYILDEAGFFTSYSDNYPYIKKNFQPENNSWSFITKFKTPAEQYMTDYLHCIINGYNSGYASAGFEIGINPNKYLQYGVGNGSSWSIGLEIGITELQPFTEYWIKFEFTGTKYSLQLSTDGENYSEECYTQSSTAITPSSASNNYLKLTYSTQTIRYWRGLIDLAETYIDIAGKRWFTGGKITTNIDETTLIGFAKENIANNMAGKVETVLPPEIGVSVTVDANDATITLE